MKKLKDNVQSQAFQWQKLRREMYDITNLERYILLSVFYGLHIEDGIKRVKDYNDMTMYDMGSELKIRIQRLEGQNKARIKQHFEDEEKKVKDLLEKLKQR
jgi:hypothetical protein